MAFAGYLIKKEAAELSMKYIKAESYTSTPDQRMDLSADRDTTGLLHRDVVAHKPMKIEFTTPYITNEDVAELNTFFGFADNLERKVTLEYYDQETDSYKTGTFYVPDINYIIYNVNISNDTILYQPIRYAFIEY